MSCLPHVLIGPSPSLKTLTDDEVTPEMIDVGLWVLDLYASGGLGTSDYCAELAYRLMNIAKTKGLEAANEVLDRLIAAD